jgi:hypothetical protein
MKCSLGRLLLMWRKTFPRRVSRLVRLVLLPRLISLFMSDRSLDTARCDCSVTNGAAVSVSDCALTMLIAVSWSCSCRTGASISL